jgi:hypothetical protein
MFYCHGRWEGVVEEEYAGEREIGEKKEEKKNKKMQVVIVTRHSITS